MFTLGLGIPAVMFFSLTKEMRGIKRSKGIAWQPFVIGTLLAISEPILDYVLVDTVFKLDYIYTHRNY